MVEELLAAGIAAASAGLVYVGAAARVVKQYERGVVFRLGRLTGDVRPPGFTLVVPLVDRLHKVNMQIITMPLPAQDGITRDNVTVRVDAVVYYRVVDPANAIVEVQDYRSRSARSRRPRCARSSARASSTTCCPTASGSTRASS